jgi:polyketide synthase PksJ
MNNTPLLKSQEHLWLLNNLVPDNQAFNIYNCYLLSGELNIEFLRISLEAVTFQYSSLRRYFDYQDGKVTSLIRPASDLILPLSIIETGCNYVENEEYEGLTSEVNRSFDLSVTPLFRVSLFIFTGGNKILTFVYHRIIIDSNSARNISKLVGEYYSNLCKGYSIENLLTSDNFQEFVTKNCQWMGSEEHTVLLKTWTEAFPDANEKIELPSDFRNLTEINLSGLREKFEINNEVFLNAGAFARNNNIDSVAMNLAAFGILLHRLSNQDSIIIGFPFSGTDDTLITIGDLENKLPVRIDFSNSPNLMDILKQLQENIAFNRSYQKISYASIINDSRSKKDLSVNPFFQTGFSFTHTEKPEFNDIEATEIFPARKGSRLDLSFDLVQDGTNCNLIVEYNTSRFSGSTVLRWVSVYQQILGCITRNPLLPSDELDIVPSTDINELVKWNETGTPFEDQICIHEKLEQQAIKTPEAIALRWDDKTFTFDELNKHVNRLASFIISTQDASDQIIAICMERSPEMIIGIYAILKSGAAYLPIDPSSPSERTKVILEDAKPVIVFKKSGSANIIPEGDYKIIELDNIIVDPLSLKETNPSLNISSESLAYIIYTSGSTGNPKGVMIRHYSVLNRIGWMQNKYKISPDDILVQKTPVTFDVSVWELFWWSFTGASLVLLSPGAEKEPSLLIKAIEKYNATTIHFVPSMFNAFRVYVDAFNEQGKIRSLKTIFLSGEALPAESVNDFYKIMGKEDLPNLVNLYGPTEATVDVSYYDCPQTISNERIYIGKPVDNTKLLVVNRKNRIQPIGVTGELVIAGINLAKGYLNRPDLNAEKFVEITDLDNASSLRVYKTGDITKWTEFGEIDYIGRIDNQVKIRGFRIELGEIEARIMDFRGVESCAVIVNRSNPDNPLLVAYLKNSGSQPLNISNLKSFLVEKLPSYMLPTTFISLEEMPLTSSGKINRKVLPEPEQIQTILKSPVSGKIESIILTVWQDVLKNDNIGTTTNFFDIGGNSIMIPLIAARLQKEYKLKVNTIDIFQYPTVESLSSFLGSSASTSSGIPELTVLNSKEQDNTAYTSDIRIAVIGISGKFPEADTKEEFWEKLCDNKECLRFFDDDVLKKNDTTFEKNKNNPDYIKSRGILNDIDLWDAKFFGYSPHDARYTDPQQRLWFETVWNALEDAGCDPFTYKGDISVFAGVNLNSYLFDNILRNRKIYEDYMHFGDADTFHAYVNNDPAFIATRTAYLFNLRGPAINIQSACSTSLLAIAQACNSLINRESDMAIAGASSIQTPQEIGYVYQPGGMRSSDGHCRPFDKNGSGTVFSNAVGAVVLKRLDDAVRDNDEIYGVIRGWAVNNDGYDKIGFAAPSVNGQLELLRRAFKKANLHPEEICYIEAHGTGTILGDPIEASALIQAFREKTSKKQFCGLGSIKGNIGHTDEVAGIMGFIKVALASHYRKIPATINYSEPNPNIDFENSPFFVVDKPIEWDYKKPMIMGVSSFGVGGTNVHVILEDYHNEKKTDPSDIQKPEILMVSGKSAWSLDQNIENLKDFYNNKSNLSATDIVYTTQRRRTHWQNKAFAMVTKDMLLAKTDFFTGSHSSKRKKTVFLFPGQGAQFKNMGLTLYNSEPLFKEIADSGFGLFKKETGVDLKALIFTNPESNEVLLNNTEFTQPALFIISYAVAKLYEQYGIIPDESIGHSIGEYVSACISEVFDFETALRIVIKRGKLMQSVPEGSMMAVRTGSDFLNEINRDSFEIAAINAPQSCTISFDTKKKDSVVNVLKNNSIEYILLNTSHAFHSSQFDIILEEFEKFVDKLKLNAPVRPFISCPTGEYADKDEVTKGNYWANQLRSTVQFDKGIKTLQQNSECIFIESGPNTHLSGLTRQNHSTAKSTKIIVSIGREPYGNTHKAFLESLGHIWMAGLSPDFSAFFKGKEPKLVRIPNYAFEKKRYWIDIDREKLKVLIENDTLIIKETEPDLYYFDSDSKSYGSKNANISDTERSILEIWKEAIGTTEIGTNDNFFELGGHSLLAVQILARIKEVLNVEIDIVKLFEFPTIRTLAEFLTSSTTNANLDENIVDNRMQKKRDSSGSRRESRLR